MNIRPNKIAQGFLLPYTKMTGLMNLSKLHSAGYPCADVQMLSRTEDLPTNKMFTVRTAVASGNDFFLPSIWGATSIEIARWLEKPIDLVPYSLNIEAYRYSFGLHRYSTTEERIANRYKPLKEIKELQFFYHPYFDDAPPYGVRGRIMLSPPKDGFRQAVIEVVKPHSIVDRKKK